MIYNFSQTDKADRYKLISQTVVPRPIAWIVTENDGIVNIAPFSFFTPISSEPPTVMVSVGHKTDGTPKDTLYNIRKNQKCVICSVEEKDLEPMHLSATSLGSSVSEAKKFSIETQPLLDGYPPIIKNVQSAMFCTLLKEVELEDSTTIPIFLKIEHMYLNDADKNHLLGRVGKDYTSYSKKIILPNI